MGLWSCTLQKKYTGISLVVRGGNEVERGESLCVKEGESEGEGMGEEGRERGGEMDS